MSPFGAGKMPVCCFAAERGVRRVFVSGVKSGRQKRSRGNLSIGARIGVVSTSREKETNRGIARGKRGKLKALHYPAVTEGSHDRLAQGSLWSVRTLPG